MALEPKAPEAKANSVALGPAEKKLLGLPVLVSSPVEIGRLIREIEAIDNNLLELNIRKAGTEVKMPKTTRLMDQLIVLNKLNLLQESDRHALLQFLESVKLKSPILHVSFSADPSVAFMEKFISWLRLQIHPLVLVTVGLQPNLGAGCVVRSTNRQFDFSLRQDFLKKRQLLKQKIAELDTAIPTSTPLEAATPAEVAA